MLQLPVGPPSTHWKSRLTLRMVTDYNSYPASVLPPKLFDQMSFGTKKGLQVVPVRYTVYILYRRASKWSLLGIGP